MTSDDHTSAASAGHEPIEADVRAVVWWVGGLALLLILSLALMSLLLRHFAAEWPAAEESVRPAPPMPETSAPLNPDQQVQLQQTRALARQLLTEYAWIDRETGVARIPIERAMQIAAAEGLVKVAAPEVGGQRP